MPGSDEGDAEDPGASDGDDERVAEADRGIRDALVDDDAERAGRKPGDDLSRGVCSQGGREAPDVAEVVREVGGPVGGEGGGF